MDENLKTIFKDLWKDKPLFITLVAGLAIVVYLFYRNATGGSATTTATGPTLSGVGATYVEGSSGQSAAPVAAPTPIVSLPVVPPAGPVAPITMSHTPGTTFLGPTGVKHFVATGTQTLSQIAQKFGLQSWNSIYAIPDNQKAFGKKLSASEARKYTPASGQTITLPPSTIIGF